MVRTTSYPLQPSLSPQSEYMQFPDFGAIESRLGQQHDLLAGVREVRIGTKRFNIVQAAGSHNNFQAKVRQHLTLCQRFRAFFCCSAVATREHKLNEILGNAARIADGLGQAGGSGVFSVAPSLMPSKSVLYGDFIPHPDGDFQDFRKLQNHPTFPSIQKQFLEDVEALMRLSSQFVGDSSTISAAFTKKLVALNSNQYPLLFPIYRETRRQVHDLVKYLDVAATAKSCGQLSQLECDRIERVLSECLEDIDKCLPGVCSRFQVAWQILQADHQSLTDRYHQLRRSLYETFVMGCMKKLEFDGRIQEDEIYEIHYFNWLYNRCCESLGLQPLNDSYLETQARIRLGFNIDRLEEDGNEMAQLSPLIVGDYTVFKTMAQEELSTFVEIMKEHLPDFDIHRPFALDCLTPELMTHLDMGLFTRLNIQLGLVGKEGALSLASLCTELDGDQYSCVRFGEKLQYRLQQAVMGDAAPKIVAPLADSEGLDRHLLCHGSHFYWVSESQPVQGAGSVPEFDFANSQAVEVRDLEHVAVTKLPPDAQVALLSQAIAQTDSVESLTRFLDSGSAGFLLSSCPGNVQSVVANVVGDRFVRDPEFAQRFIEHFGSYNQEFPQWVLESPLLDPLLQTKAKKKLEERLFRGDLIAPRQRLQIFSGLSVQSLSVIGDRHILEDAFRAALNTSSVGLLERLLLSERCNRCIRLRGNSRGFTPLMLICQHGSPEALRYLLKLRGLDVKARDDSQKTAWDYAGLRRDGNGETILKMLRPFLGAGSAANTSRTKL